MSEHESMQVIKYAKGKGQRARHMLARTPDSDPRRRRAWRELCGEGKRERAASSDATAPSFPASIRASARPSVAARWPPPRRTREHGDDDGRRTHRGQRGLWPPRTRRPTAHGGGGVSGPSSFLPPSASLIFRKEKDSLPLTPIQVREREREADVCLAAREKGRGRERSQCSTYLVGRGRPSEL